MSEHFPICTPFQQSSRDLGSMVILHLTTSPFFGGPERQILGLMQYLPNSLKQVAMLFADRGKSRAFGAKLREEGQQTITLNHDTPNFPAMVREVTNQLRERKADVLCCHGYKADIVGLLAARRASVPAIAISHGWTAETWKVRIYEAIDRAFLRNMDRVVCVSAAQAAKVRRAGVEAERVVVSRNAICPERFNRADPGDQRALDAMFPHPPERIIGSTGRLSPEKGFGVLVEAAAIVARSDPGAGFIHFGDGPLRQTIGRRIRELGLERRFILAGFRDDVDRLLPHCDLSVLPSFTEGLPTVVLESYAAGVPVVATAVGGTPEVVTDGVNGYLVPPGDSIALARRILDLLESDEKRRHMGMLGRERIRAEFTYETRARRFQEVCEGLVNHGRESAVVNDFVADMGRAR